MPAWLIFEVGVDVIEGRVRQLSHYLRKQLQQEPDIKLLSPQADRFTAGTTFHVGVGVISTGASSAAATDESRSDFVQPRWVASRFSPFLSNRSFVR